MTFVQYFLRSHIEIIGVSKEKFLMAIVENFWSHNLLRGHLWEPSSLSLGYHFSKVCDCLLSCEAEIIALSEAAKDVVYLRKFISGMTGNQIKWPTQLRTDNKAARDLSYNPEIHNRTKHVARRHFFIRDTVQAFELNVPLVSTVNNFADFFTKALKPGSFTSMRNKIMNMHDDNVV